MNELYESKKSFQQFILRSGNIFSIILILIIFGTASAVINPNFMQLSNWMNIFRSVSVIGIMSCTLTFVMLTGNIDLSCGSILALCGCVCCSLVDRNIFAAILAPLLVGALFGLINGVLVGLIKVNSFVVTLGMQYVILSIAFFYTDSEYLVAKSEGWFKNISQGSFMNTVPYSIFVFGIVVIICAFILHHTVFGAQLYMVGSNPIAAKFSGISSTKMIIKSYVIGGIGIGLSSILLVSRTMAAQPAMGEIYPFEVLTAVVVGGLSMSGGKGTIWGTLLGVLFVGILENGFTVMRLNSHIQSICLGIALILAVIFGNFAERRMHS